MNQHLTTKPPIFGPITVEVFKTKVATPSQANALVAKIQTVFGFEQVNFDLEDCDRILRVEGPGIDASAIILFLQSQGCQAEIL